MTVSHAIGIAANIQGPICKALYSMATEDTILPLQHNINDTHSRT